MLDSPAFRLVGVGFSLAFWIVAGALLGRWLDGRFETAPALTLLFLVLGMSLGFYDAYRRLRDLVKAAERKARR